MWEEDVETSFRGGLVGEVVETGTRGSGKAVTVSGKGEESRMERSDAVADGGDDVACVLPVLLACCKLVAAVVGVLLVLLACCELVAAAAAVAGRGTM